MKRIGDVAYAEIFKDSSNRSKGCGIVEFRSKEDALRAIEELNDSVLGSRKIFVREDRENNNNGDRQHNRDRERQYDRGPRNDGRSARNEGRGFGASTGRKVFVGNLSFQTTWRDLKEFFAPCGEVERADVAEGPDGRSLGRGTVLFASSESARRAIKDYHDLTFQGRKLIVHEDKFA
jgi:RNA recognition motif-containing protein